LTAFGVIMLCEKTLNLGRAARQLNTRFPADNDLTGLGNHHLNARRSFN
jgi:hypothetical protein